MPLPPPPFFVPHRQQPKNCSIFFFSSFRFWGFRGRKMLLCLVRKWKWRYTPSLCWLVTSRCSDAIVSAFSGLLVWGTENEMARWDGSVVEGWEVGDAETGEWEDREGGCPGLGPSSWIERANSVMKQRSSITNDPSPPIKPATPPHRPFPISSTPSLTTPTKPPVCTTSPPPPASLHSTSARPCSQHTLVWAGTSSFPSSSASALSISARARP